jgi:hypothetical protein
MTKTVLLTTLVLAAGASVAAQTPEQVAAEPLVQLQPGETAVEGECLTRQELDVIAGLNALRRPTVGVEGTNAGDDQMPFNPHYYVGTWEIEGVLPESPIGSSGEFLGTETVRYVGGCTYEGTIDATIDGDPLTVQVQMYYDRRAKYLVRVEDDSRGFRLVKSGRVGGDAGGYFTHHWTAPGITRDGSTVRLSGAFFASSPFDLRLRMRLSVDDGPFANYGTVWWRRPVQ